PGGVQHQIQHAALTRLEAKAGEILVGEWHAALLTVAGCQLVAVVMLRSGPMACGAAQTASWQPSWQH
ncbi:hypothetical protein KQH60_14580, partial [Mycetohabitans sp. B8]